METTYNEADHAEATPVRRRRNPLRSLIGRLVILAVLIALVTLVPLLIINSMRGSRNTPLEIAVYPGAKEVGAITATGRDLRQYTTNDGIQQVFAFYNERIPKTDEGGCQKNFTTDPFEDIPGKWWGLCKIDDTLLDAARDLTVRIVWKPDPADGDKVKTIFEIEKKWGNQK